ncbi:MAG: DNA gyrase inhibitor YacG [Phycisphaerae bacterium]
MTTFSCSICGKAVAYEGPLPRLYPFCSERCRLVDLGRWFNEQYSIDRDLAPEDLPDGFPPPESARPD